MAAPGGQDSGDYNWMGRQVRVEHDGHLCLSGTPYLAGAGHLLDHDLENFIRVTGLPVQAAILTVTRNPARLIASPESWAALKIGSPADIVAFHVEVGPDNPIKLRIDRIISNGEQLVPTSGSIPG